LLFVLTRMEISFPEIAKMKVSRYICQSHKLWHMYWRDR